MRRALTAAIALAALAVLATPAQAKDPFECQGTSFGFCELGLSFSDENGQGAMQAGSHPFAQTTTLNPITRDDEELGLLPHAQPKDLRVTLPEGFVGSPDATPKCSTANFTTTVTQFKNDKDELINLGGLASLPDCPDTAAVGVARVRGAAAAAKGGGFVELATPVYNLEPPPGVALRLGFKVVLAGAAIVDVSLEQSPPYRAVATVRNITQLQVFYGSDVTLWSAPGAKAHDDERGICGASFEAGAEAGADLGDFLGLTCPASIPPRPFFTLPRSGCGQPLPALFEADAWSGEHAEGKAQTPEPLGGCERTGFGPEISSQPTSRAASSPSGLDFELEIKDEGLTNIDGIAHSDIKKAVVTLPEGMTANPSQAEGLEVCSESDFDDEGAQTPFGAGCPAAAKIGSVEVETPLLDGVLLRGQVFIAEPYRNRFGTLLALYMTIREPQRGIFVGLAGKVEPDPRTGQLITTFDDLPKLPFSHFRFHFREGGRSPLITPPGCGTYVTEALFTPWANPSATHPSSATFQIERGPEGRPCPKAGTPPFEPGFAAGSQSNQAGSYSPFAMRLTRRDGDQDLTRFSATLPPGVVGRLTGVAKCPDAQIAIAKAKSGKAELASPSCPLASLIGTATAGAGAGSQLTYVDGRIYLAGPYNGAPLSVVAIVPAVAGPFDVGTIVTRQALVIDPRTAQVRVDGDRSDPIPHILAGIPLSVRDIRANVNRSDFTLNPTSCEPAETLAGIWGGGANPFSLADDAPIQRESRFQAAGCRGLAFHPKLDLRLKGGTKRAAHPALHAVYTPRQGHANLERFALRLPRSAFLDQAHIRTICTRVQFRADNCPAAAIYGHVKAFTPLLGDPLQGPVYLRSSDNNLPDLVFDLHSSIGVDVEAVARIDSIRGGIRATFTQAPDAPISRVIVDMQGGKKGLIVNSTDLCERKHRANASLDAHSGAQRTLRPLMRPSCGK